MAHTPRFALRSFIARIARVNLRFAVVTVLVGAAMVSSSTRAQRAAAPENFDVRSEKSAAVAAYLSRFPAPASFGDVAGARATGLARLQTDFPGIDIVGHPELGTPELVGVRPGTPLAAGKSIGRLPYGVCIAVGTIFSVIARQFGLV